MVGLREGALLYLDTFPLSYHFHRIVSFRDFLNCLRRAFSLNIQLALFARSKKNNFVLNSNARAFTVLS